MSLFPQSSSDPVRFIRSSDICKRSCAEPFVYSPSLRLIYHSLSVRNAEVKNLLTFRLDSQYEARIPKALDSTRSKTGPGTSDRRGNARCRQQTAQAQWRLLDHDQSDSRYRRSEHRVCVSVLSEQAGDLCRAS